MLLETLSLKESKQFIQGLTLLSDKELVKGKTIIFFDEIQEFKEIATKLKFLVQEGSFKYILSGSLLGVELRNIKSAPVGSLTTIEMFPMDFYEYIKALNIKDNTLTFLKDCCMKYTLIPSFMHEKMLDAFRSYLLVGGMPEAVYSFITEGDYNKVSKIHNKIIEQYKLDFTKYEEQQKLKLLKIYELIPSELSSKNKRFIFKNIDENFKFERYENSFNWHIHAGVAIPVYNITEPRLPLKMNEKSALFKFFLSDVGLLSTLYGKATQLAILNDNKSLNCGAIYENFVAQELRSHGFEIYYFNNHKQGEIDFVIEFKGKVLPIEVKSGKDYQRHSALDNVLKNHDYNVENVIVLSNSNISINEKIIYLPIYCSMFIQDDTVVNLNKIDLSSL